MNHAPRRRPVPDTLFGGRLSDCQYLDLEVVDVHDQTARLRTIRFASPDLVEFAWQPGQDVMLEVLDREQTVRRRYTIRRADPAAGTLDIDVVRHGTGPFARWAEAASPGEHIEGIGPRGTTLRSDATHHLFVGDETAIPVVFAMVESLTLGAGTSFTVLLATEDASPPSAPAGVSVVWTTPAGVADHLRGSSLPSGTVAYVNGERSLVRSTVELLTSRGLPAESIASKAYWRRDQSNAAHGEPAKD